jgi:peptidoglycan/xylan/chitin deacetylase (PgdA/CDA1 family)
MPSSNSPSRHSPSREITHALSFDIEDWFHIVEIAAVEDPDKWPELHARSTLVERYTDHILSICDAHEAKATFFMLGWVAERHPQLVRRIADAGHELATHSFWHRKVYELTPEVFSQDIADSIDAIRAAPGLSLRCPPRSRHRVRRLALPRPARARRVRLPPGLPRHHRPLRTHDARAAHVRRQLRTEEDLLLGRRVHAPAPQAHDPLGREAGGRRRAPDRRLSPSA